MPNLYELEFSPENFSCEENAAIYQSDIYPIDTPLQIYVFNHNQVKKYKFNRNSESWQNEWIKSLETHNSTENRILYFPTMNHTNKNNIVLLKTSFGINFYQFKNNNFDLIRRSEAYDENIFHDAFLWNESNNIIMTGHFYRNDTLIGVLTKHENFGVQFYVINQEALYSDSYPVWPVAVDSNPIENHTESDFFSFKIKSKDQENIIVRNRKALIIYEFDENYDLKIVMEVGSGAKSDDTKQTLFFPNLTGQLLPDIVVVNKTGAFIYQYDKKLKTYDILHYDPLFSEIKGWTKEYVKSIKFEDLNADGIHEMIFTGPRGIDILSFDRENNEWMYTLDNSEIPVSKRHGKIMTVIPSNIPMKNNSMIFTNYGQQVNWANIMFLKDWSEGDETSLGETASELSSSSSSTSSSSSSKNNISSAPSLPQPIPQIFRGHVQNEKLVHLLRDYLDMSYIMNGVDKNTGKVVLQLPLVDLSSTLSNDIKLNFIYNSISQESSIMGVGWSLPQNFITMNPQYSVFKELEIYYIVVEDMPTRLIVDSNTSTNDVYSFKLPHNTTSETQIRYYKKEEKWEIKGSGTTQTYGRAGHSTVDPIVWEIYWKNWRGIGNSTEGQIKIATSWYLVEVRDDDNAIKFTYDVSNEVIPGSNSFTREIYLKTITSTNSQVHFKYSNKNPTEYKTPKVIDQDGFIQQQLVISRYLEGYEVSTPNHCQTINFIYEMIDGKRFLTEIKQQDDPIMAPVLQFNYKDISKSYFLEKVTLPPENHIEFKYESVGEVSDINRQLGDVRVDTSLDYRVTSVENDVIVSYIQSRKIILKMFKPDKLNDHTSSMIYPVLGLGLIQNYKLVPMVGSFAVQIDYDLKKELHFFSQQNESWLRTTEFTLSPEAVVNFSKDFVIVTEYNLPIQIIEWNKDSKKWQMESFKTDSSFISNHSRQLVAIFENMFLVYDDYIFWIAYKDHQQIWHSKKIKGMLNGFGHMEAALDRFQLGKDISKKLLNFFKSSALQLQNNLFAFNRWFIEGNQLYIMLDLFILDSNYEIVKEQQFKVIQEDLSKFELENEGLKLGYKTTGNEFKITVKHFSDSVIQKIEKNIEKENPEWSQATEEQKTNTIQEVKNQIIEEWQNASKTIFLLNPLQLLASFNFPTTTCGNDTFTFNGNKWEQHKEQLKTKQDEKNYLKLGEELILARENKNSTIKLYEGTDEKKLGEKLVDLETTDFQQILNAYPTYLAYQRKNPSIPQIIKFSKDGKFEKVVRLPDNEQLTTWSNYQMIVSSIENFFSNEKSYTLVFRQMTGLNQLFPNPVVTRMSIHFEGNTTRTTAYEYKSPQVYGNAIYYQELLIIPGNNKTSFGYIQENRSQRQRKVFDGQDKLVEIQSLEQKNNEEDILPKNENLFSTRTIYDTTGRFKVAEFFTSDKSDEEVGYYGFEDYEENVIGLKNQSNKKWIFDESGIQKNGFSLTGQNYLKIFNNILYGIFQPKNQNQDYIVSCWIRAEAETFEDAVTSVLTANIFLERNDEIYEFICGGKIKYRFDNWYYVEVLIDFAAAKENTKLPASELMGKVFKTSIVVRSNDNWTIDIDHIRFSPLNNFFQGTVYDFKTMQIKDEISHDGLIKRHLYDIYHKEIASVDGYGQINEFSTYTKASSIGRMEQIRSITKIQPQISYYENFAPFSFKLLWKTDNSEAWQISPNKLYHMSQNQNELVLNISAMDSKSYGIGMYLNLDTKYSHFKLGNDVTLISFGPYAEFQYLGKRSKMPLNSEIIIIIENTRLLIWIDGGLYFDGPGNNSSINSFDVYGNVKIYDVMIFNQPCIEVTYLNSLGEKLQEIRMENENSAIITEYLYDELGRQTITTQPARLNKSNSERLLAYQPNFVTNRNPVSEDSVWKLGQLSGKSSDIVGKYGFSQIEYFNNPLNHKSAVGLPGKGFSLSGPYSRRFSSSCDNLFINNFYPTLDNYTHQVEYKSNGVKHITVFDSMKNKIAQYEEIPQQGDILSTYEYDDKKRLIKTLPPSYHKKVQTLSQIGSPNHNRTIEDNLLQESMGIFTTYDENGKVVITKTPDSEKIENIYDDDLLIFTIFYDRYDQLKNVIYFGYDEFDRLSETGELINLPPRQELTNLITERNNTKIYQQFFYSDFEQDPLLRKKTKRTITYNEEYPVIEESVFTPHEQTSSKRIIIPSQEEEDHPQVAKVDKQYISGKVVSIKYPSRFRGLPLNLIYKYNKLNQIVEIRILGHENPLTSFTYNSAGQVNNEQFSSGKIEYTNVRSYKYNSVGFLIEIKDKFLTEEIFYTENSYGGLGYGDGRVTSTRFKATWHEQCDNINLNLNKKSFEGPGITSDQSELCFYKLKETGYLDSNNRQAKVLYPQLSPDLPMICTSGVGSCRIQNILGMKGYPSEYGHLYDYGNQQELTKAKYFVGEGVPMPLQPETFSREIIGLNSIVSQDIWLTLNKAGYIIKNNDKTDLSFAHGKRGKSFIRSLFHDLGKINTTYRKYERSLQRILAKCVTQNQNMSSMMSYIEEAFDTWNIGIGETNTTRAKQDIIKILKEKQYLQKPLTDDFARILQKYQRYIPQIVRVLEEYFGRELGEGEFDVQSYEIDENGNHKLFYTGFDRYELDYSENTNQISNIKYQSFSSIYSAKNFGIKHDIRGNVIQALHKGIKNIEYNLISNRPTKIQLEDGRNIIFHYDVQGERVLKKVTNKDGEIITETHYIRDELGRTLVEENITFTSPDLPPDILTTSYIYGPRGLMGFIRRDEFFSVFSDHEGSIRLVIKDNEVVAAYDYLPYGNMMRKYGNDPDSHISYLYTGQEFDEETGLYNFHARFYDPSIGRFYQIDPKMQYFSPYKYAGNSPVSMIDPDGQFAILLAICIVGALVGGYLGGASANHDWRIWHWKLNSKTVLGVIGGGIGGGLLPLGFTGGAAVIGLNTILGVGVAYLNVARTNNNWNPAKWNWTDPSTYDALFQGFGMGSGFTTGSSQALKVFSKLGTKGKIAFGSGTLLTGGTTFYLNGKQNNWDWTKPGMYASIFDAQALALDLPMFIKTAPKFFWLHGKTIYKGLRTQRGYGGLGKGDTMGTLYLAAENLLKNGEFSRKFLSQQISKNVARYYEVAKSTGALAFGVVAIPGAAYLMYSAAKEDGGDNISPIYLYHAMINGMVSGGQLSLAIRHTGSRHSIIKGKNAHFDEGSNKPSKKIKNTPANEGSENSSKNKHPHSSDDADPQGINCITTRRKRSVPKCKVTRELAEKVPEDQENPKNTGAGNKAGELPSSSSLSENPWQSVSSKAARRAGTSKNTGAIPKTTSGGRIDTRKITKKVTNLNQRQKVDEKKPAAVDLSKSYANTVHTWKKQVGQVQKVEIQEVQRRIESLSLHVMKLKKDVLMDFIAQGVEYYAYYLRENHNYLKNAYPPGSKTQLYIEKGMIPNRVLTVAVGSDMEMVMALSGLNSPALVSVLKDGKTAHHYSKDNRQIGNKNIYIPPSADQKRFSTRTTRTKMVNDICRLIKTTKPELKIETYKKFAEHLVNDLQNHMSTSIKNRFWKPRMEAISQLDTSHIYLSNVFDQFIKVHKPKSFEEKNTNSLEGIENFVKAKSSIIQTINRDSQLYNDFGKIVSKSRKAVASFENWAAENCAESHTLMAVQHHEAGLGELTLKKYIDYFATYKFGNSDFTKGTIYTMEPFDRCRQCKIITEDYIFKTETGEMTEIKVYVKEQAPKVDSNNPSDKKVRKRSVLFEPTSHTKNYEYKIDTGDQRPAMFNDKNTPTSYHENHSNFSKTNPNHLSIYSLFNWIKTSASRFFETTHAIPNNSSSSNTTPLQFNAQFDTNSTILLLDLFVRKVTEKKFVAPMNYDELLLLQIQGDAINILTQLENILKDVAEKSGIPLENLNLDPIEAQNVIIDQLRNGEFSKISQTLYALVEKVYPDLKRDPTTFINLKHRLQESFGTKPESAAPSQRNFPQDHESGMIQNSGQNFLKISDTITRNVSNIILIE